MKPKITVIMVFILLFFNACSSTLEPTPTPQPTPTLKSTATPEPTLNPTQTPIQFQTLDRLFPEGFDSPGVWSNEGTGDVDSRNSHFDVEVPYGYIPGEGIVIAPASGEIVDYYSAGDNEGYVITIRPMPLLEGIDELAKSNEISPSRIRDVYYHIGHINPYKTSGFVEKGESIGTTTNSPWHPYHDIIAYIIRVILEKTERQYSPCDLPNTASFCGICAPATGRPCP